jgi:hypothetical protein
MALVQENALTPLGTEKSSTYKRNINTNLKKKLYYPSLFIIFGGKTFAL